MLVLATFAPASPGKISNAWFPSMAWSSLHDAFFLPLDITSQNQVRACTRYHTFSPHQCIFIHLLLPCTCTLTFSCILTHAFYCSLIAPSLPLLLIICDGECLALIRHESHNVSSSYFFLQTKKKTRRWGHWQIRRRITVENQGRLELFFCICFFFRAMEMPNFFIFLYAYFVSASCFPLSSPTFIRQRHRTHVPKSNPFI